MGSDMAPDSWSHPEIVRALQRIEAGVGEVRADQKAAAAAAVSKELWDSAWLALGEWKSMVTTDVVNLDAALTRHIRDGDEAHQAIRAHIDERVAAERADRVSGQRWAIGLAVTGILGIIGTLIAIVNAAGLGA
jgi:hypothetical protein